MGESSAVPPLLEIRGLTCHYGTVPVVESVDLVARSGEITGLVGSNGAGKSSILAAIMGFGPKRQGELLVDGIALPRNPRRVSGAGVVLVPEGRRVFAQRNVEANLLIASWARRSDKARQRELLESVYDRFPVLKERRTSAAGSLSGGQAQMLAVGMALMADPKLLLLDEPCLGLAPIIVNELFVHITQLRDEGMGIVLVEQSLVRAVSVCDDLHLMRNARITHQVGASEVHDTRALAKQYLM